jgi:hypothetical protein
MFDRVNHKGTVYELWESIKHTFGDSSKWDDEPKVEAHEHVEHDHNLVIVKDCSTSWSSNDDDRSTTSSLDKIDGDASSDAIEDATPCTLDGDDDGSCPDDIATTSPSTTPHCIMSQGDTKVSNTNVVNHVDSYDELVSRLASMTMSLENEKAKIMKLKNENSFLKKSCEDHKHLLDVLKSSHDELIVTHEKLFVSHEELLEQHASLIKMFSKEIKNNESSSHDSSNQLQHVTNSCDIEKKHVSTSCNDLLDMPCCSHVDACSTSMSCETNILKENTELKREVKNLSNKLERCYNSKVTFEHILKTQRNYDDKYGLGFKKKMTKDKRKRERNMKKLQQRKLSHTMCYRCYEASHLANACSNVEKLKLKKEEERLKHVKCFKYRTWGHLTSMCQTKQLVKQQEEPQPKLQDEQEKKPQEQVKINHENGGDLLMKKKKTRRGGRARHLMLDQDAKMTSKNQIEKRIWLTSSASSVVIGDTLPLSVLLSLRRRLKKAMGSTI